ncbi:hypothetical protein B0H14DRAFT_3134967, partial [Mycena olivaceomarginata]
RGVIHQSTICFAFSSPFSNKLTFSLSSISSTLIPTKCSLLLLPSSPSWLPVSPPLRSTRSLTGPHATLRLVSLLSSHPSRRHATPAALQLGANTPLNTACLVAAAKGTAAFPTACAPCAAQFGVTDPGNKSGTATNGA